MRPYASLIEPLESRIAPATIIVNNGTDTPQTGTLHGKPILDLRQALAMADADLMAKSGVVNTIIFDLPKAAPGAVNTITLGSTGVLTSHGDVNIVGPGSGALIINGGATYGIFSITDGTAGTDRPVSISGLSLINGSSAKAGAIYSAESLSIKNCVISGNVSSGATGGIVVQGNPTTALTKASIVNCTIVNNTGELSGGVALYNVKSFSVSNTLISGNVNLTGFSGGLFANIYAGGGSGSITNTRVTGNTSFFGSGLALENANTTKTSVITVKGSVISGNIATESSTQNSGFAGGIFFSGGNIAVSNTAIEANTAYYAGGGVVAEDLTSLTISHSIISGNRTTNAAKLVPGGGGIDILGTSGSTQVPVKIIGSQILDNQSAQDGGGILVQDTVALSVASTAFRGNVATGIGGGLAIRGNTINQVDTTLTGSAFINNIAAYGGGLATAGHGTTAIGTGNLTISNSLFNGNLASADSPSFGGGGLSAATTGSVTLNADTFSNNTTTAFGGGAWINSSSSVLINGGLFLANSAEDGGGIEFSKATGEIKNTTVTANIATDSGGGIDFDLSSITQHTPHILANTAPNGPNTVNTVTV